MALCTESPGIPVFCKSVTSRADTGLFVIGNRSHEIVPSISFMAVLNLHSAGYLEGKNGQSWQVSPSLLKRVQ